MNESLAEPASVKQPPESLTDDKLKPHEDNTSLPTNTPHEEQAIKAVAQPLVRERRISREYLGLDDTADAENANNQNLLENSGNVNQNNTDTKPNVPTEKPAVFNFTTTLHITPADQYTATFIEERHTELYQETTSSSVLQNTTHGHLLPENRNSPSTRGVTGIKSTDTTVALDLIRVMPPAATRASPGVDSSSSPSMLLVPLTLAVLLIIGSVLVILFVRKRRGQKRRRKETEVHVGAEREEIFPPEGNGPIYAMVDLSKKKKKVLTPLPADTEMLQLIRTSEENGHCLSEHEDAYSYKDHIDREQRTSPSQLSQLYQTLDCQVMMDDSPAASQTLVENEIYESTEMVNRRSPEIDDAANLERPPPTYVERDRGEMRASKDLPPLPQCVGAHADDTDCPLCCSSGESESESNVDNLDQQVYLSPRCHDHPPKGPNWKPFHPYDPVYVPTSSAGDMDRRVDSTGYVSRKNMRATPQVYEEINYSTMKAPPLKPKMIMGATASGGRKPPPRMLPVTPRNSVSNDTGAYGLRAIAAGLSASVANGSVVNSQANSQNSQDVHPGNTQTQPNDTQNSVPESNHLNVNGGIPNTLSAHLDNQSPSRDSRASSTVSSNGNDMYETVEFPDPDV